VSVTIRVKMPALVSAVVLLVGSAHGTVMRGPITPVCSVGTPCSAPARHVTLFFTRHGVTRKTTTDERGRYRIRLAAGLYSIRTNQRPFGTTPQPNKVRVRGGRDVRVDLHIDTGIR
jgi:hypothetical protein